MTDLHLSLFVRVTLKIDKLVQYYLLLESTDSVKAQGILINKLTQIASLIWED